jgi:hypothetical protein
MIKAIATTHSQPAAPNGTRGVARKARCDNADKHTAPANTVIDNRLRVMLKRRAAEAVNRSAGNGDDH